MIVCIYKNVKDICSGNAINRAKQAVYLYIHLWAVPSLSSDKKEVNTYKHGQKRTHTQASKVKKK